MSDFLACSYSSVCSGCEWLLTPRAEQNALKVEHLRSQWTRNFPSGPKLPEVRFVEIAKGGLRDRIDWMVDRRSGTYHFGLFDRFQNGILDLQGCPQLSPQLEEWLGEFRRVQIPVMRGSVRLRVAPNGMRGAWLDLANIDVKNLLEEKRTLLRLMEMGTVEIGQRRKRLIARGDDLKLIDPVLEPWFETTVADDRPISLYCTIGSFTQPGREANRFLVREVMKLVKESGARRVGEFGAGIGNFTVPLASMCELVHAYEVDRLALEGLNRSLTENEWQNKVHVFSGNFQTERKPGRESIDFTNLDLVLADPPRSGLMHFLDPLECLSDEQRPRHFIYVSCFAESFAQDASRLYALGYEANSLCIVDQFPQSRHYEVIAGFQR